MIKQLKPAYNQRENSDSSFICQICKLEYKYRKALINHTKKCLKTSI